MQVRGCGTALVTPFHPDGSVDENALRNLVAWQVESGIDFLIPCGTTGETPTLSREEWLCVIDATIDAVAGRTDCRRCDFELDAGCGRESPGSSRAAGSERHPHSVSLLQQADTRGSVSPLQGDRRGRRQADPPV